jgi:hypothetical protein
VRYNTNLPAIRLTFTGIATCQYGRVPCTLCVVRAAFRRDLIRRAASIRHESLPGLISTFNVVSMSGRRPEMSAEESHDALAGVCC